MRPPFTREQLTAAVGKAFPDLNKTRWDEITVSIWERYGTENRSLGPWTCHEAEDNNAGGFTYDVTRGGKKWMGGVFSSKDKAQVEKVVRLLNGLEG